MDLALQSIIAAPKKSKKDDKQPWIENEKLM